MKNNLESNNTSNANTNPLGKDAQIEITKESPIKRYLIPALIGVAMFVAMFFIAWARQLFIVMGYYLHRVSQRKQMKIIRY